MAVPDAAVTADVNLVGVIQLCIAAAAVLAVVFHRLRQPALLAYIVAGLLMSVFVGPMVSGSVVALEKISHLGLALLLFVIGLELDLKGIFRLGPRVAAALLLQAPIAIAAILGIQWGAHQLGFTIPGLASQPTAWFHFAVAVALGSTAVVVKLLGDRFDLTSAAGRISVLTLIAQDIWAVLALSYVSGGGHDDSGWTGVVSMFLGAAVVAVAMVWLARSVIGRVAVWLARAPDLLAMLALAWCFLGSAAMAGVGLSAEMGALLAGLSLGRLPVAAEILAKMTSLRDFFMAIFFVALGMSLPPPTLAIIGPALALVGIVILARLLLYAPTLFAAKLGPVVSLAVPINLSQLSEFSLLLVAVGITQGAMPAADGAVIAYALMLSVILTSYAIPANYRLALWIAGLLRRPVPAAGDPSHGEDGGHAPQADIVVLGYHHNAEAMMVRLREVAPGAVGQALIVDYNLKKHEELRARGWRVTYGDISNPETLRHCGVEHARVVVSTIGDSFLRGIDNRGIVEAVHHLNPRAFVIATAESDRQEAVLREAQASAIVRPPTEAAPAYAQHVVAALNAARWE